MIYLLLAAAAAVAVRTGIRYYKLKHALREAQKELEQIRTSPEQNRMLHLPVPDRDLEQLLHSMNLAMNDMRCAGQAYKKREKQFQEQIENISHDLRTPLTVILGYLRLLRDKEIRDRDYGELEEMLGLMERKARSLEQLVSSFYSFSRLTAGDCPLKLCRIDAGRILRETLTEHYQVLAAAGLDVEAAIPDHPVWIWGDQEALERIYSNLYQNAARYAESFLRISIKEGEGRTVIRFENDTVKVTLEEVSHLFDRFFVRYSPGNQDSTGLGLTIARYLAQAMAGTLEAGLADGPGNGDGRLEAKEAGGVLCFTLCFPDSGGAAPESEAIEKIQN